MEDSCQPSRTPVARNQLLYKVTEIKGVVTVADIILSDTLTLPLWSQISGNPEHPLSFCEMNL